MGNTTEYGPVYSQPRSQGFFSRRRTRMKEREKESPGIVRRDQYLIGSNISLIYVKNYA